MQVLTWASHSARRLAGRCGRIGFTLCHVFMSRYYGRAVHLRQLSTPCCHDAVAFGYRRVNVSPDGDSHPAVCTPSQAHERGIYAASTSEVVRSGNLHGARMAER